MRSEPGPVEIRLQRGDELSAVQQLNDLAFGAEHRIGDLVADLQADPCYSGQSWVAEVDGDLVGHTMLTRSWLDAEERLLTAPVLSPLAVHPAHQGLGIGAALVGQAIAAARASGAPGIFLEGDPAFYGRFGFEPAGDWGIERPSARIPYAAFQWVRFPEQHEPWMRGRLVYPDVFWRHDAVGLRGWRGAASGLVMTTVTLGARDLAGLARFYADLLGRPVPEVPEGEDWVSVRDPDGGISIGIQLEPTQPRVVWPAGEGEQHMQVHLEIRVDDLDAAVAHAVACGATLAAYQPQHDVRVCLDPEGHPFCLWVPDDN